MPRTPLTPGLAKLLREQGHAVPKKRSRTPEVRTDSPVTWSVKLTLPCRVVSEANRVGHWSVRKKRFENQQDAVMAALCVALLARWVAPCPAVVTLTHVGPRMDDDNLAGAFKGIRDFIANQCFARDDGDESITWVYKQETGPNGVRVEITNAGG